MRMSEESVSGDTDPAQQKFKEMVLHKTRTGEGCRISGQTWQEHLLDSI